MSKRIVYARLSMNVEKLPKMILKYLITEVETSDLFLNHNQKKKEQIKLQKNGLMDSI